MSEPDNAIQNDILTLEQLIDIGVITLDSFTANPDRVPPCGGPGSSLSWSIGVHPNLASRDLRDSIGAVKFELDQGVIPIDGIGTGLPRIGAKVVQAISTSDFVVLARLRQVKAPLGSVTVTVDPSRCQQFSVAESLLKGIVQTLLNQRFGANSDFKLAGLFLEIRTGEVVVRISFTYGTPIGDVSVELDAHLLLLVQDCRARVTDSSFATNVQFPAFLELLFPVLVDVVEAFVGAELQGRFRPELLQQFQNFINQFLPQELCLCRLETVPHQINVIACPNLTITARPPRPTA